MGKVLRIALIWFLVAFVGDTMLGPMIAIKGVAPDFSVIAIVVLALAAGAGPASAGGFFLGLIHDLSNPSMLGLQALGKSLLGYGLGSLRGRLIYGVPLIEGLVVALSVFAHDFFFLIVQSSFSNEQFLAPLFTQAIPAAIYSGLVGIPVIRFAELMGILAQED